MDTWRERILKAVETDGRSARRISLAAKLGENFVTELRNTDKSPSVDKLLQLAAELNVSAVYLFTGVKADELDDELISAFVALSTKGRQTILELARQLAER